MVRYNPHHLMRNRIPSTENDCYRLPEAQSKRALRDCGITSNYGMFCLMLLCIVFLTLIVDDFRKAFQSQDDPWL